MRFDVLTLFPELFGPHLEQGVTRRAYATSQMQVRLWQLRDFADDAYRRIDDRPFGGGPGMVMMAGPLERGLAAAVAERGGAGGLVGLPSAPLIEMVGSAGTAAVSAGSRKLLACHNPPKNLVDSLVSPVIGCRPFFLIF